MQDLLADFLTEASDLLDDVDIGLVELEQRPDDAGLLNQVFRGFHTVKGGAGFLEATPLVELCHRGENLLDLLRSGALRITPEIMDVILAATGEVRRMFSEMERGAMPEPAPAGLLRALEAAAQGQSFDTSLLAGTAPQPDAGGAGNPTSAASTASTAAAPVSASTGSASDGPDWLAYYRAAFGDPLGMPEAGALVEAAAAPPSSRPYRPEMLAPSGPAPAAAMAKDATIRVDTARFDQILNLSGEIGLTKNRLACLRDALLGGRRDDTGAETLDAVFSQLDTLVSDLQSAVMMARMQPVGRVFQKYSRLARDLARQLDKDVELIITGGETEVDKTILDELNDPLVHLIRNAVDHGVETMVERRSVGKPARGTIHLSARQTGDSIVIEVSDDGRGMDPEVIRRKAIEKGVISAEDAAVLDAPHCLQLIFLPGFSTRAEVSDLSGRGVGMDVVKTNIEKLKGQIDIQSSPGMGSHIVISLPLTLAILPVLMLKLVDQPYAIPLSVVREIIPLRQEELHTVGTHQALTIRGEILPVIDLAALLGRERQEPPSLAVVLAHGERQLVLGVDGFIGQDEVMIKPLEGIHPKGVAGATLSGDGTLVLVLEMKQLLEGVF